MSFDKHLNGWRRLGVILFLFWVAGLAAVLSLSNGVRESALVSSKHFETRTVSIPAPEMKEKIEAEKIAQLGRQLKPWEKEWAPTKTIVVSEQVKQVSIQKIILLVIVLPILLWLFLETVVLLARWIIAGFSI